jgi:hypothetical protein
MFPIDMAHSLIETKILTARQLWNAAASVF